MKKILISVFSIAVVGAVAFGATRAFFSDTETSTGNVLAAGAIDLKIDNTSYVTDVNGVLVESPGTSWDLRDLTIEKFFNFIDLKPGDIGEDTISVHVNSNDAWLCAAARVTVNSDETCTEPENSDESSQCVVETDGTNGDLASQVNFAFWKDDGDNVLESDEAGSVFLSGPISGLNGAGQIALADSNGGPLGPGPIAGDTNVFIGKAWCFGTLTPAPVAQGANDPLVNTGFTCDGSGVDNTAQTDKVVGDLQFYAVQSRNNADFTCANDYTPDWPEQEPIHVTSNELQYGPNGWGGWSCPADTTVVDGSLVVSGGDLFQTFVWKPGATTGSVNYPNTPFGYTYGSGETGYIGQNDNDSGESIVLSFDCLPN